MDPDDIHHQTPSPTFGQALIAGALAGVAADVAFYPLDTIKTRLQSSSGFVKAGGFRGIYAGMTSVIVGGGPGAAIFFTSYETIKTHLPTAPHLAPFSHVLAASLSETIACFVRVPTEVVKQRTQAQHGATKLSSLAVARVLASSEGFRGFYRGFGATVYREIPFAGVQYPIYEFLKRETARRLNKGKKTKGERLAAGPAALCGSVAGAVAGAVTTPLDVLKTRIMLDTTTAGFMSHVRAVHAAGGVPAFFAGIVPRTLWIAAGGAVFLGVYESGVNTLIRAGVFNDPASKRLADD
ncbi:mitochondrial carrier [Exidia glandulosa HHB12029]|uniref:Mitochondrial carrier n=1 Tax=Exidia glandulosa HHB12029 TaxID=1314781 RepID=A0A165G5P6_EXIGL|nr:mitochondrial carrier [Exidia glandulosa HHB12029]